MRSTGGELQEEVSEAAMFRLGRAMTGCLRILTLALQDGVASGDFEVANPVLLSNTLYASGLCASNWPASILVDEVAPGVPTIGTLTGDDIRDYLVTSALALAKA